MQCVILAGGLGTRMAHLSGELPKTLIPVDGVPFAAHQLRRLALNGVTSVVYSIGHRGDLIRDFVGDGSAWGVQVEYLEDGPRLLGTAGALRKGLAEGMVASPFLLLYGDSYLTADYGQAIRAFEQAGLPALMTVYRNEGRWEPSNVIYESGLVHLYDKRPESRTASMRHIEYGLSVLTSAALREEVLPEQPADLADVSHILSLKGRLAGHEVDERFYEIGSPGGLEDLERYLRAQGPSG